MIITDDEDDDHDITAEVPDCKVAHKCCKSKTKKHCTATICPTQVKEENKDLTIEESLEIAFKQELPKFALSQIGDYILAITDRIIEAPSVWQMPLTPLLLWFTIHQDDQLVIQLFENQPDLVTELARLHSLVSTYCYDYQKKEQL